MDYSVGGKRAYPYQASLDAAKRRRLASQARNNPAARYSGFVHKPIVKSLPALRGTNAQAVRTGGWANPTRGGELKFVDTAANLNPIINSPTFSAAQLLNGLAPGSTASTRIGRKVTIKSIYIRWNYNLLPTSVGGANARILVVYDRQANAAVPPITEILDTDNFISQNNLANRDRFVTIFDQILDCVSVAGEYMCAGTLYKSLNLDVAFNAGTAGTIGDITSGSIYMFVAQQGGITIAAPNIDAQVRIRYTDL